MANNMPAAIVPATQLANSPGLTDGGAWDFIDHAYCLNLSSRPDRQEQALRELSRIGIFGQTSFVLSDPELGPKPPAIFESHCRAARDAVRKGYRTVLITEDDVTFQRNADSVAPSVRKAMERLPGDWEGLYLGHFPLRAYFVFTGLLRASSGCSHAYLANRPLLDWLAGLDPWKDLAAGRIELNRMIGQGIDAALARRPRMYACFPMLATQGNSPSSNINSKFDRRGQRRGFLDRYRYSALLIRNMRAAEWIAALLSPLHWLSRSSWLPEEQSTAPRTGSTAGFRNRAQ